MSKYFNTEGSCFSTIHYMADISKKIEEVKILVDAGKYFTINRARQYGKTTLLYKLSQRLSEEYTVFSISFEGLGGETYQDTTSFCREFSGLLCDAIDYGETVGVSKEVYELLSCRMNETGQRISFREYFNIISKVCKINKKPIVLMIDEVDQAGNSEVFLSFLAMLRDKFLKRMQRPTFYSVILVGVHDIKSLKLKIRDNAEHQYNSPWNVATDFMVDMSLSVEEISSMLREYEEDKKTGMDILNMATLLYDYTSGYPFLVSRICKIMDERWIEDAQGNRGKISWDKQGFLRAVRVLLEEDNTLFESLDNKLLDYPQLKQMLKDLLLSGKVIDYVPTDIGIRTALLFGFVFVRNSRVEISNRIFETRLYNVFLAEEALNSEIAQTASFEKNMYVKNGYLDMDLVVDRFVMHYTELFGNKGEKFVENEGRDRFLLFLRPIINGTGNYYVEAQTRDKLRTDIIVDYLGRQYIVELKIWRGEKYHIEGEKQLVDYLELYHQKKGYMIIFNFNQKKEIGIEKKYYGDKILVEGMV